MKTYELYCYDPSMRMWCLNRTSLSLKFLKDFVYEERNIGALGCACYISCNGRILKRYPSVS